MDPFNGSEPQNAIATCVSMLSLRRFSSCRDFAHRLPPSHSTARILAVADVLSAPDLYSVLSLHPSDAAASLRDLARRQYAKLALLLDPTDPDKLPFSDEALARVQEAWHVLSHPERRARYDRELRVGPTSATFWTGCPYCWNLFEYEKRFEECALQCQVCGKSFQGVAVKPPQKMGDAVVEEEELRQYYSCEASVPLMYYEVKEGENRDGNNKNMLGEQNSQFVYISDDDDEEHVNVRNEGNDIGKRRMRVKTVAKKGLRRSLDSELDFDLDVEDGELEFTEGDDDVFVGVRFDK